VLKRKAVSPSESVVPRPLAFLKQLIAQPHSPLDFPTIRTIIDGKTHVVACSEYPRIRQEAVARLRGAVVLFQQISSTLFGVSLAGRLGNPYAWPQADSH
jgi:hypothetical protein